jgi:LEA14-like dessication related protein
VTAGISELEAGLAAMEATGAWMLHTLFLGLLAAVWYAVEVRASEGPRVTSADATWVEGSNGTELRLELVVDNPRRTEAEIQGIEYRVWYGDRASDPVRQVGALVIPADAQDNLSFTVALPGFPATWWQDYVQEEERGLVRIEGELSVVQSVRKQAVPFDWEASWRGSWDSAMADDLRNCPRDGEPLCLSGADPEWTGLGLGLVLEVRNQASSPVNITDATATLRFRDAAVAGGGGEGALPLAAGQNRSLSMFLAFDDEALAAWWPDHVEACESSPTDISIRITVATSQAQGTGENATVSETSRTLEWEFEGPALRTQLACRRA